MAPRGGVAGACRALPSGDWCISLGRHRDPGVALRYPKATPTCCRSLFRQQPIGPIPQSSGTRVLCHRRCYGVHAGPLSVCAQSAGGQQTQAHHARTAPIPRISLMSRCWSHARGISAQRGHVPQWCTLALALASGRDCRSRGATTRGRPLTASQQGAGHGRGSRGMLPGTRFFAAP
jgi:hypothetical protein